MDAFRAGKTALEDWQKKHPQEVITSKDDEPDSNRSVVCMEKKDFQGCASLGIWLCLLGSVWIWSWIFPEMAKICREKPSLLCGEPLSHSHIYTCLKHFYKLSPNISKKYVSVETRTLFLGVLCFVDAVYDSYRKDPGFKACHHLSVSSLNVFVVSSVLPSSVQPSSAPPVVLGPEITLLSGLWFCYGSLARGSISAAPCHGTLCLFHGHWTQRKFMTL